MPKPLLYLSANASPTDKIAKLNKDTFIKRLQDLTTAIQSLNELAIIFRSQRMNSGAISFDKEELVRWAKNAAGCLIVSIALLDSGGSIVKDMNFDVKNPHLLYQVATTDCSFFPSGNYVLEVDSKEGKASHYKSMKLLFHYTLHYISKFKI